jgi:Na+-driven multidrug efflux pump
VFHERIFAFYTDDRKVVELMRTLLGPYFVYCFFDALMFIGGNTYKALRMGKWITTVFFVSYYGVGGSTLILLAVTIESKLWAAWIGFTAGSIAITVLMWLKSRQIDLEELTERLHMEVKN